MVGLLVLGAVPHLGSSLPPPLASESLNEWLGQEKAAGASKNVTWLL